MSDNQKRIFLSYSMGDRKFAAALKDLLGKRGADVFWDTNVQPGQLWAETLRGEIEEADALVLLLPSRDALNRNNLWFEAGAAKALGKPVLMVLPPEHKNARSEAPTDLADLVVLNADETSMERLADTLIQATPKGSHTKFSPS
jgi:nucleoside 2-deoxyribosyltransferase